MITVNTSFDYQADEHHQSYYSKLFETFTRFILNI